MFTSINLLTVPDLSLQLRRKRYYEKGFPFRQIPSQWQNNPLVDCGYYRGGKKGRKKGDILHQKTCRLHYEIHVISDQETKTQEIYAGKSNRCLAQLVYDFEQRPSRNTTECPHNKTNDSHRQSSRHAMEVKSPLATVRRSTQRS